MSRSAKSGVSGTDRMSRRAATSSDCGSDGCGFKPRRSPLGSGNNGIVSGASAAIRAGRRPLSIDDRAVDRAVLGEITRYLSLKRRSKSDRARLRAVLVPFIQAAGGAV